jgi:ABC-type Fe3+/spermidine/putrescine transport system ATPase subunit
MREEIRRIQQQAKVTTIYVTHDQEEALSISDRIAVMHAGNVSQVGSPDEIYENPNSVRVADFIGQANFFTSKVQQDADPVLRFRSGEQITLVNSSGDIRGYPDREGILFVRPEQMEISSDPNHPNSLRGEVKVILYLGSVVRYYIEIFQNHDPQEILVDQDRRVQGVGVGDAVAVLAHGQEAKLFPTEQRQQLEKA